MLPCRSLAPVISTAAAPSRASTSVVVALVAAIAGCLAQNPDFEAPPEIDESASATTTETAGTTETTASTSAGTTADPSASATTVDDTGGGLCGDGVVDADEVCDDGRQNGSDASNCSELCLFKDAICGNGAVELGEECDDGNITPGDGCSGGCTIEPQGDLCGDGILGDNEGCDDGNDLAGDGCEPDCTPTPPSVCGDGIKDWDELCDDGNDIGGDGCEPTCTPTPEAMCVPPELLVPCDAMVDPQDPLAPFKALGLGCADDPKDAVLIAGAKLVAPDPKSWRIARAFGAFKDNNVPLYGAREGSSLLVLSTGTLPLPAPDGTLLLPYNSQLNESNNDNPDDEGFLPGYKPVDDQGGTLPGQWAKGMNDPSDKIFLSFKTKLPKAAKGYSLDLAVFMAEWPHYVDTEFADCLVIWEVSEAFTGNVAVIDGQPLSSQSLHPHWSTTPIALPKECATFGFAGPGYACQEPELAGTGFEGHAATRWLRLNRPAAEGTDLELFIFLADMVASQLNTVVLLDRLRVECEACTPIDDPACGGDAPDLSCCGLALPQ